MPSTPARTAVITGATSDRGIGMTVAQRYAREGWAVVILDLDVVAAELVAAAHSATDRGVELWSESLHFYRLCYDLDRATALTSRLPEQVGIVMDFSHIVASGGDPVEFVERFGPRIAHVHIRDAVPGDINLSVGNGDVEFAFGLKALSHTGYAGHFSLELETRDITHDERPAAAARAGRYITELIK